MKLTWLFLFLSLCACDAVSKTKLKACFEMPESEARDKCLVSVVSGVPPDQLKRTPIGITSDEVIDRALAATLKDPLSLIDYSVSQPYKCAVVDGSDLPDANCICYAFNAKNSFGAYSGRSVGYAFLMQAKDGTWVDRLPSAIEPPSLSAIEGCDKSGLIARDPENVRKHVRT